jgi:hypothetical protein
MLEPLIKEVSGESDIGHVPFGGEDSPHDKRIYQELRDS